MELCTIQSLPPPSLHLRSKLSDSLAYVSPNRIHFSRSSPRRLPRFSRSAMAEESPVGAEIGVVAVEEGPAGYVATESAEILVEEEPSPPDDLFAGFQQKFNNLDAYSILPYGAGALVGLWLVSTIIRAIDSVPLFPKLMELVGLGYSFWFTTRFLLFKQNREELAGKIEDLKQQVLGSND